MKLAFIIPIWNRNSDCLERCLESIDNTVLKDQRKVVVGYGKEIEKYKEISKKHNAFMVELLDSPIMCNKAQMLNLGVKISADCEYVFPFDVDLLLNPNSANMIKSHIDSGSNEIIAFCSIFLDKSDAYPTKDYTAFFIDILNKNGRLSLVKKKNGRTGMMVIKRDIWVSVNGMFEGYFGWGYEDTDFLNVLYANGHTITSYTGNHCLLHVWHEKSARNPKNFSTFLKRKKMIGINKKTFGNPVDFGNVRYKILVDIEK